MLTAGGRNRSHRNLHFSLTAVKRTILLVELSFLSTLLSQSFFFFFKEQQFISVYFTVSIHFFPKKNKNKKLSFLSTSLSQSFIYFSPKKNNNNIHFCQSFFFLLKNKHNFHFCLLHYLHLLFSLKKSKIWELCQR